MSSFSMLDSTVEVGGSLFLEASAGTGKTFAIEHLVVRLLLQGDPFAIDRICLVTFTKAAARELRARIHSNILDAMRRLDNGAPTGWDYLDAVVDVERARRALQEAISGFDGALIETIHGFCYRLLGSFGLGELVLIDDQLDRNRQLRLVRDFFRSGVALEKYSARQINRSIGSYRGDSDRFFEALLRAASEPGGAASSLSYSEVVGEIRALHAELRGEGERFLQRYREVATSYRAVYRRRSCEPSLLLFAKLLDKDSLEESEVEQLIASGLEFLIPIREENLKKGAEPPPFPALDRLRTLLPLIEQIEDRGAIFSSLAADFRTFLMRYLEREELLTHDRVVGLMRESLLQPDFLEEVRGHLSMVIVDEFQDTDPAQWAIFRTLCSERALPLVLVGDPKQSIYRFRGADIYTYLEARNWIGEERCHTLATNYRSKPALVEGINALFSQEGLFSLPRTGGALPYMPVEAAEGGQGGEVHLFEAEEEEALFTFIGDELIRKGTKETAILVSRWEQGIRLYMALQRRGIPSSLVRKQLIGTLSIYEPFCDLVQALADPTPQSVRRVIGGLVIGWTSEQLAELTDLAKLAPWILRFRSLHREWLRSGLCSAIEALSVLEKILSQQEGGRLAAQFQQLVERASSWEVENGIDPARLVAQLADWREEEIAPMPEGEGAEILTIHGSKGLEYEVVFALGVMDRSRSAGPQWEEENAEKARRLYVALTRAKSRLYIPLLRRPSANHPGKVAPIELLTTLPEFHRITLDGTEPSEGRWVEEAISLPVPIVPSWKFTQEPVLSYSALSRGSSGAVQGDLGAGQSRHTLPRGAETGLLLHSLLERVEWDLAGRGGEELKQWVSNSLVATALEGWGEVVSEMIESSFHLPLGPLTLANVDRSNVQREMEFLFPVNAADRFAGREMEKGALFGVIDLLVQFEGRTYLIDWKSNWLGGDDEAYCPDALRKSIELHDYSLQASIYLGALERFLRLVDDRPFSESFGGVYYLFLRGPRAICLEEG